MRARLRRWTRAPLRALPRLMPQRLPARLLVIAGLVLLSALAAAFALGTGRPWDFGLSTGERLAAAQVAVGVLSMSAAVLALWAAVAEIDIIFPKHRLDVLVWRGVPRDGEYQTGETYVEFVNPVGGRSSTAGDWRSR